MRRRAGRLGLWLVIACAAGSEAQGFAAEDRRRDAGPPLDDRSTVRFQYACTSTLSRRDVTLFANGTVRLREGPREAQELYLDELGPDELASSLRRLEELASSGERPPSSDHPLTVGDWVAECEIVLDLPEMEPWSYRFSEHEVPPLLISSLIHVADELADGTHSPASVERVPAGYEPQSGDVLRTAAGERFLVLRPTADGRAIELDGLDTPLRLYVEIDRLSETFVAVEPRAGGAPAKLSAGDG